MTFRVEIAGGMAAGKTTLCEALAAQGFDSVLENLDHNPLLKDFYRDMERYAFPFQLSFVSSKFRDIAGASLHRPHVLDYAVVNGRAYSILALKDTDPGGLDVILRGYDHLEATLGPADFILHLDCPLDIQRERLAQRRRAGEENVPEEYLQRFNDILDRLLKEEERKGRRIFRLKNQDSGSPDGDRYVMAIADMIRSSWQYKGPSASLNRVPRCP